MYDGAGRLMKDTDAATGFKSVARSEISDGHTATLTTALGRTTSYQVRDLTTGDLRRVNTDRAGFQTLIERGANGVTKITRPDGMIDTVTQSGDPSWRMLSPLPATVTSKTPAGLLYTATFERAVTLSDPNNLLSLTAQNDTLTVNGRTYTRNYAGATRTFTLTTPVGRQVTTTLDMQGRLTQDQFANFNASNFTYDTRGRLSTAVSGTGAQARSFSLSYNPDGYISSITDPLSRTVSYLYDAAGRITQKTLPDGRIIGYGYDAMGRPTTVIDPNGQASYTYYDSLGRPIQTQQPANTGSSSPTVTGFTYNSADGVREFFARQGRNIKAADFEPRGGSGDESGATGPTGLKVGTRVRHAKYGVGLIVKREGDDENAKLTINFPGYGHKKMIEKYAALEKA